mgnify:CR=1 FL=1
MMKSPPEPVQVMMQLRNEALRTLVQSIPYIRFLGIDFDRRGDELTAIMSFNEKLIGNPKLPALHGGAIAAFLEVSAVIELSWSSLWKEIEAPFQSAQGAVIPSQISLPKTIDFTVDYLRSGLPRDSYARARVTRSGRRYASVFVEAWQDNRDRIFAQATGHFLMPKNLIVEKGT